MSDMKIAFKFKGFPVITGEWLKSSLPRAEIRENGVTLKIEEEDGYVKLNSYLLDKGELKKMLKKMGNTLHAVTEEGLIPLVIRSDHFYKLRGLERPGHPTLEIDGIHMHRISGVDPWNDTLSKVKPLKLKRGHKVLDTCMGLGYTSIASLKRGANVVTVEKSEEVVELAQWNPWSRELEEAEVILGDIAEVIREFSDESFDRIIHDPPVITMAGHLYSVDFYKELYRVLKPGGILFHYTGNFGRSKGVDLARGVMERLREVGFEVKRYRGALGVMARKPL